MKNKIEKFDFIKFKMDCSHIVPMVKAVWMEPFTKNSQVIMKETQGQNPLHDFTIIIKPLGIFMYEHAHTHSHTGYSVVYIHTLISKLIG